MSLPYTLSGARLGPLQFATQIHTHGITDGSEVFLPRVSGGTVMRNLRCLHAVPLGRCH